MASFGDLNQSMPPPYSAPPPYSPLQYQAPTVPVYPQPYQQEHHQPSHQHEQYPHHQHNHHHHHHHHPHASPPTGPWVVCSCNVVAPTAPPLAPPFPPNYQRRRVRRTTGGIFTVVTLFILIAAGYFIFKNAEHRSH
ncbi:uncharacterized protein [Rhodnius prolixus]|uniref:uncharacterized protein n=1 Tax=Rhodnius prolixus TaxID=13249 RepID=UPI003D18E157